MGILDALLKMGINDIDSSKIYDDNTEKNAPKEIEKHEEKKLSEADYLFLKSYTCDYCSNTFKSLTLKSNKARFLRTDELLRPIYEGIEPLKYEAVCCPDCGYCVMNKYMIPMTASQRKAIAQSVDQFFCKIPEDKEILSYEEAVERIKLALAVAIIKKSKASEKAYICLKGGWLLQAYMEELSKAEEVDDNLINELRKEKEEFLSEAYVGLKMAREKESFPIIGLDNNSFDYLLARLAFNNEDNDVAAKLVAGILQSKGANRAIKDKALELKNELLVRLRNKEKSNA